MWSDTRLGCNGTGLGVSVTALLLSVPLALNGESGAGNTAIGVISVVSIVSGYLLLWALWHFVFRERAREKRKRASRE
jgi:hypothetical protein